MDARPPLVMGILNVTPDSFSDGGLFADPDRAVEQGLRMAEEGADIVDVGGESTRPGAEAIGAEEELRRILPVVERLAGECGADISIDTTKPEVARDAVARGARMINDVSALGRGEGLARVAAETGVDLVLMHSRGSPRDMQLDVRYDDAVEEVRAELAGAAERAEGFGVDAARIWLDPGIGFAKLCEHSVDVLAGIGRIADLGYRVLVGPSRKSFIGDLTGAPVGDRLGGTAAAVAAAVLAGARAVRVHDVATMRQAAIVAWEISRRDGERR